MKRTFQPSLLKRARRHGFRARMSTRGGRAMTQPRRPKGRKPLSARPPRCPSRLSWHCTKRAAGRGFKTMITDRQAEQPRRLRFTRSARLVKPIEFKRVFKRSRVSSDHCFKILFRLNDERCNRLGMAVSRQIDKRAVGRNRIKRVIRESFRENFHLSEETSGPGMPVTGGVRSRQSFVDLVVLPRKGCATICNKRLFESLEGHWLRIGEAVGKRGKALNSELG